jgi:hypothetical protein
MNDVYVWDSEAADDCVQPVEQDPMFVRIDDENGILRLADYHANGMHTTCVSFIGPDAEENAHKWDAFVKEDRGGLDLNCDTEKLLKLCFGVS